MEHFAKAPEDDVTRCAIYCELMRPPQTAGCAPGACVRTPIPEQFYSPVRAAMQYGRLVRMKGSRHELLEPVETFPQRSAAVPQADGDCPA